jgi:hypothetical protein
MQQIHQTCGEKKMQHHQMKEVARELDDDVPNEPDDASPGRQQEGLGVQTTQPTGNQLSIDAYLCRHRYSAGIWEVLAFTQGPGE